MIFHRKAAKVAKERKAIQKYKTNRQPHAFQFTPCQRTLHCNDKNRQLSAQSFEHPVSSLDVAATACAVAGIETGPGDLDGVNLIPHLKGENNTAPHEFLCWRWGGQGAIREGNWKLLLGGTREYLFDLGTDLGEKDNLAAKHPEVVERLRTKLETWSKGLKPPGLAPFPFSAAGIQYFDHYLDGKTTAAGPDDEEQQETTPARRNARERRRNAKPKP